MPVNSHNLHLGALLKEQGREFHPFQCLCLTKYHTIITFIYLECPTLQGSRSTALNISNMGLILSPSQSLHSSHDTSHTMSIQHKKLVQYLLHPTVPRPFATSDKHNDTPKNSRLCPLLQILFPQGLHKCFVCLYYIEVSDDEQTNRILRTWIRRRTSRTNSFLSIDCETPALA